MNEGAFGPLVFLKSFSSLVMKPLLPVLATVSVVGGLLFFNRSDRGGRINAAMPESPSRTYDEMEMQHAIKAARARVGDFIAVLESNGADSYSVKVAITDGPQTEHFWLSELSYENGVFSGNLDGEPSVVKNVHAGQPWEVKKDEISDWMYVIGEKAHGGFTIDPQLPSMPKEQVEAIRKNFVR